MVMAITVIMVMAVAIFVIMYMMMGMPVAVFPSVRYRLLVSTLHCLLEVLRAMRVVMGMADHPAIQQRITLHHTGR